MNKKRQGNNGKVGSTLEDRIVQDISIAQDRPRQDKVGLANSRGQGRTSVRQVVEDKKAAGTGHAGHCAHQSMSYQISHFPPSTLTNFNRFLPLFAACIHNVMDFMACTHMVKKWGRLIEELPRKTSTTIVVTPLVNPIRLSASKASSRRWWISWQ